MRCCSVSNMSTEYVPPIGYFIWPRKLYSNTNSIQFCILNISHICLLLSNPSAMTPVPATLISHLDLINSLLPDHSVLHWLPSKFFASSSQVFQKPESDHSLSSLISAFPALCWALLELSLPSSHLSHCSHLHPMTHPYGVFFQ